MNEEVSDCIIIGALRLAGSLKSMLCASWMQYYFSLVGDHAPNTNSEIHLDPVTRKDIYEEYKYDMINMSNNKNNVVSQDVFQDVWSKVFPYVKVRKYKSSCGHCNL